MRAPSSRSVLVGLGVVVVVLAGAGLAFRQQIGDVYGYFFPDGIVDDARSRTAPPASVADDAPDLPEAEPDPAPPTTSGPPAISLRSLADVGGPSALVDPTGPGPVLVSTLEGRVLAVDLGSGTSEVVLDISERVSSGGEQGLLGLAIDPAGDRLYLNHTNLDGDTEVVSLPMADGLPDGSADDLVQHLLVGQPYRNHNGGHLVFGPDDALWIGLGDGGSAGDPAGLAQDPDELLGKMLRVIPDPSGGVQAPASNPDWGGRPEIWGIGLRNPWRYSFDRETGRLWVADVGQDAVEEVTAVDPDADRVNFGWDLMEGTRRHEGEPTEGLTPPALEYGHDEGCSITGGFVYRGEAVATLRGWYLFGDFCGGWIRAVPADRPGDSPIELAGDLGPVVSFAELEDGELVVLTGDQVLAVEPA